jgi:hypothetical protein
MLFSLGAPDQVMYFMWFHEQPLNQFKGSMLYLAVEIAKGLRPELTDASGMPRPLQVSSCHPQTAGSCVCALCLVVVVGWGVRLLVTRVLTLCSRLVAAMIEQDLMREMWQGDPAARPPMDVVAERLGEVQAGFGSMELGSPTKVESSRESFVSRMSDVVRGVFTPATAEGPSSGFISSGFSPSRRTAGDLKVPLLDRMDSLHTEL